MLSLISHQTSLHLEYQSKYTEQSTLKQAYQVPREMKCADNVFHK